jgi:virginiamycin B lyase
MTPEGIVQSHKLSTPIVRLGRLAIGPDGAVWFADAAIASVTRLKDAALERHDVSAVGGSPYGVVVEPNGSVWTTLQGSDKLGRISPDGQFTAIDVPTRNGGLADLTLGPDGAVWFVELRSNKIGRIADGHFTEVDVPTPSAGLTGLAAAPDGAVWFTELSASKLGRIHDGHVAEFPLPPGRRPFGIAVDAANNVWYTDLSGFLGMLPANTAKR